MKYLLSLLVAIFYINANASDELKIVTSFSILEDITKNIVQDKATVISIIPIDSDAHAYNLHPKDLITINKSDLFIINSLGFETFLKNIEKLPNIKEKTVIATEGINAHNISHDSEHHHEHHEYNHGNKDPHAWQDPQNAIIYVKNITNALCLKDSTNCESYKTNADNYIQKINELDNQYKNIFANIKQENRVFLTTHDAFNYLAEHYDIKIYSLVGIDSNTEPSPKQIAIINNLIKDLSVKSIFIENITNNAIINQIAKQNNVKINGTLYSDSLSSKDAQTYLDFLEHNLKILSDSMK
ncbi:MAG: metal ABC transporter substrate-binding protein [Succinivibrionaceae bacterium]|nr:metal ABC transporter substrate-binding protein [Succinivibrionaceae bacterium]